MSWVGSRQGLAIPNRKSAFAARRTGPRSSTSGAAQGLFRITAVKTTGPPGVRRVVSRHKRQDALSASGSLCRLVINKPDDVGLERRMRPFPAKEATTYANLVRQAVVSHHLYELASRSLEGDLGVSEAALGIGLVGRSMRHGRRSRT
jgi:hypothetical protein